MRWESLDPERVERAIQALLRHLYPGLRSFDGAGGDGGRDAQLVSDDGHTVFEIKSFGRLTSSRRKQVERSLRGAVDSTPAMTRWVLVIPMNMTPTRPSVKSAEEAWFTGKLQAIAPEVDLDWWGQDWLDGHFAERPDLQRLIEGPQSQLLALASEHAMEQAALSAGAPDLHARLRALRSRADSLSPYWTLGFSVINGVVTSSLEAKVPEAAEVDPIRVTSTFRFRRGDEDDERLQQEFERTLAFGGEVDLPAGHLTDFVVEASPQASMLFDSTADPKASSVSLRSERVAMEPHVRCRFDVIGDGGEVLSRLTVWFRERTVGARGIMLFGCDAAGILKVELGLPRPERVPAAGETVTMGGVDLRLHLPDTVVGLDVESLHPVFTTLAAARPGTSMRFDLPGLGQAGGPVHEPPFERAEEFGEVVSDLRRLEMELGVVLRFPAATIGQFEELRRVIRCIDGETVEHDGGLVLGVRPGMVQPFLEKYDEVMTEEGGLFSVSGNRTLTLGSTEIDIGPVAFWAPRPRLANRPELEAASGRESPSDEVDAVLEPQGVPFRWLSRELAASYLEQSG